MNPRPDFYRKYSSFEILDLNLDHIHTKLQDSFFAPDIKAERQGNFTYAILAEHKTRGFVFVYLNIYDSPKIMLEWCRLRGCSLASVDFYHQLRHVFGLTGRGLRPAPSLPVPIAPALSLPVSSNPAYQHFYQKLRDDPRYLPDTLKALCQHPEQSTLDLPALVDRTLTTSTDLIAHIWAVRLARRINYSVDHTIQLDVGDIFVILANRFLHEG
uniref:Uncharacterized protein n=1 Tax=viral metagenome TaxID=1070528 RepID=A0A6C0BMD2_9ZZZZ